MAANNVMQSFLRLVALVAVVAGVVGATDTVVVTIDVGEVVMEIPDMYVCVGMDWWPNNKCNYGVCPWEYSSILNADLSSPRLNNALAALAPVMLRIGGTQADNITYAVGSTKDIPCPDFTPGVQVNASNFRGGCLNGSRFEELLQFCDPSKGCHLAFGINAMNGRDEHGDGWDSTQAAALINATVDYGYQMHAWEFGNELQLSPQRFADSLHELHGIISAAFEKTGLHKPLMVATDQISWDSKFMSEFVPLVKDVLDVITWHDYPLGPGYGNPNLEAKVMSAHGMDGWFRTARGAVELVQNVSKSMNVWMGETGGAYNSGHNLTSNAFIYGFWYLQSMAGFARSGHQGFCRQTFLGGNYELVDKYTHVPNPDFYNAVLFRRLMGKSVLATNAASPQHTVQAWAHCTGTADGSITLLLLNYANSSIDVSLVTVSAAVDQTAHALQPGSSRGTSKGLSLTPRDEYILSGINGDIHARLSELNGEPLVLDGDSIPAMPPRRVDTEDEGQGLTLAPHQYGFVVLPKAGVHVCM